MKFIMIDAKNQSIEQIEAEDFDAAKKHAGLDGIDFGHLGNGMHIIVYEYGLCEDPNTQKFFSLGRALYAGNAVIFRVQNDGTEDSGKTIDVTDSDLHTIIANARFYDRVSEVLFCIKHGALDRPEMAINGEVIWRWPDPHPYHPRDKFGTKSYDHG